MTQAEITFPFGKHKNEPIGQVPTDYLQWILSAKDNEYFATRQHHVRKAADELSRRGVVTNVNLNADGEDIAFNDIGTNVDAPTAAPEPTKTTVELPIETLNEASKSVPVLKAFLRRLDQEQGLHDWMKETAKEAIRHGDKHLSGDKFAYAMGGTVLIVKEKPGKVLDVVFFDIEKDAG